MVTAFVARWEKVYARAWDLGEMRFDTDMAKGQAKDPSEMCELIAYVKLQWGGSQLVLLPGDDRVSISTDIGILSPLELICVEDTGGVLVVNCWKGSPRGLSATPTLRPPVVGRTTNPVTPKASARSRQVVLDRPARGDPQGDDFGTQPQERTT